MIFVISFIIAFSIIVQQGNQASIKQSQFCSSNDFDNSPNIEELLKIVQKPDRIRVIVELDQSQGGSRIFGQVLGERYTLTNFELKDGYSGRLFDLIGKAYNEKPTDIPGYYTHFKVDSYKIIPYSVICGKVKIEKYLVGMGVGWTEYYNFETTYKFKKYTFNLGYVSATYPSKITGVDPSKFVGKNVCLAGVVGFDSLTNPNRFFYPKIKCD